MQIHFVGDEILFSFPVTFVTKLKQKPRSRLSWAVISLNRFVFSMFIKADSNCGAQQLIDYLIFVYILAAIYS